MKKILTILALAISFSASAQWQGVTWTNGNQSLSSEQINPQQVMFLGAGFYDAGYGYLFNVTKNGSGYDLQGTKQILSNRSKDPLVAEVIKTDSYNSDGTWKRREVSGFDLLLRYEGSKLTSIYAETSLNMAEYDEDKIMELIEGQYKDASGKTYSFGTDGKCNFGGKQTTYSVLKDEAAPSLAISVSGKNYVLKLTKDGMNIYNAVAADESQYKAGSLVISLKYNRNTYRWSNTTAYPLSEYVLMLVESNEVLRLMRNEIYARKGWKFSDSKLTEYFSSYSWYKPGTDNNKVKLTDLEQLNVDLIKHIEFLNN